MATPFTNKAIISYNGVNSVSNTVSGEINDVLSINKTAVYNKYVRGDTVTFTVSLINLSNQAFTDLTITDDLGAYSFTPTGATTPITLRPLTYKTGSVSWFVDGVPQTTALTVTIATNGNLVISGVDVTAQGVGTGITHVMYSAIINENAPIGTAAELKIENTVAASGTGITGDLKAKEEIFPEQKLDVTIEKGVSPTSVPENGTLTYTLTISNYGARASTVDDDVILTDTFIPYLANIDVKLDGITWPDTNYNYGTDGKFVTVTDALTLNAATITQNTTTGVWEITPSKRVLTISGKVSNNPV